MLRKASGSTLLCAAVFVLISSGASASGFKVKATLPADPGPTSVALGDFNHDGKLDLAVASYLSNQTISVQMGNGDGTFQPIIRYAVGVSPWAITVADLNLDGVSDLVVANAGDDTISVLLGNGDGTFRAQVVFAAGDGLTATAVGDLNNDDIPDIATASLGASVLLGNGDGTFQAPLQVIPNVAYSVAVGDFNRDGKLDLALGEPNGAAGRVEILLGHGDGSFQSSGTYTLGVATPYFIAMGDLNHDGKLDLVASTFIGAGVAVLLGHGDGTFRQAAFYGTPASNIAVVMADFNRDGNPDVAASLYNQPSFVSVFNGNGDGTLQPAVSYNAQGGEAEGIAAGDLNGDGSLDIVMTNGIGIAILLNTGGTFLKTTSSLNPSHQGNSVTFTTKIKQSVGTQSPTGTVTFKDGSTTLGTVPLTSGVATFTTSTLSVGSHKIFASYSGDANFNPNDAKPLTQVVNP